MKLLKSFISFVHEDEQKHERILTRLLTYQLSMREEIWKGYGSEEEEERTKTRGKQHASKKKRPWS